MSQPYPPSTAFTSLSGYITPIPCQYCREQAHLVQLGRYREDAELRTFECEACGQQTELTVLR